MLDTYFYIVGWIFVGIALLFVVLVQTRLFGHVTRFPDCSFRAFTGLYCPGCGGTRAVFALLHGHLLRSLFYHPIVGYSALVGGWFMLSQTIERLSRHRWRIGMHYRDIYLWIALAIVLVNWGVRNLLLAGFGIALLG